jgi:hypothetical protein
MSYEVDSASGRCLYRGDDLELACDIYDHETGAHLQLSVTTATGGDGAPADEAGEDSRPAGVGWDRPPQARVATV